MGGLRVSRLCSWLKLVRNIAVDLMRNLVVLDDVGGSRVMIEWVASKEQRLV